MARKKKKREKKRVPGFKLKKETIFSIIAVLATGLGVLSILSFLYQGIVLIKLNNLLVKNLGWLSFFSAFLLFLISVQFSKLKIFLKKITILVGAFLLYLSALGLFKQGDIGVWFWDQLAFLLSPLGAGTILTAGVLVGVLVLFDSSLEQLLIAIKSVVDLIKKYIFADPKKKKTKFVGESSESPKEQKNQPAIVKKLISVKEEKPVLKDEEASYVNWELPSMELLYNDIDTEADRGDVGAQANTIEQTLESFGIRARVKEVSKGPAVTQYALEVALGTKLSKITSLSNDLALALAAPTGQIRIEAPIPGRSLVGVEVPNKASAVVSLYEMLSSKEMQKTVSKTAVPLGFDVSAKARIADISKMPHVLIAGQTGAGKSVLLNSWISSILFRAKPDEVKFILVDPKRVELTRYNGIPHLLTSVLSEPEKVVSSLKWAIKEMEKRYKLFAEVSARNLGIYNQQADEKLPYIIIVIDELADIMLFSPTEVEDSICRIAQMARATGIHLILATQRPSVDVLTGLIKANIPSRISFAVASMTDSRVILDSPGAEKLLGNGDMLYIPPDQAKPTRIQGSYVTDAEVDRLVNFLKEQGDADYQKEVVKQPVTVSQGTVLVDGEERDEFFDEAEKLVKVAKRGSASLLQRKLHIGYARAARILDQLEAVGIVGPARGSKARKVI